MIRPIFVAAMGIIAFLPRRALWIPLLWLALFSAKHSLAETLSLTQEDRQYPIASRAWSSGFFPVTDNKVLSEFSGSDKRDVFHGLNPNFKQHERYWLFTEVTNTTQNRDWVLHISNFGFKSPKVLLMKSDEQPHGTVPIIKEVNSDINTIGRATTLELEPGQTWLLLVELRAQNVVWHPYIALMSADHYQTWKAQMDFAFKLAIGIIVGLILVALICWILMSDKVFFWGGLSSLLMLVYYLEHSSLPAIFWQSSYEKTFLFWLLVTATLLSQTFFAAAFLQLNKQANAWYRAYIATLVVTIAVLLASFFLPLWMTSIIYACNYLLVWGFILGSGVAKVRSHGTFYVLYLIAWLPMALSILHVMVVLFLPKNTNEVDVSYKLIQVLYVQILHMLIHAAALISRVKSLRDDKVQAEYLNQAKSRFIAQSSHDLRQPLKSMNLFLEYLHPHIQGKQGQNIFGLLKKTQQHMENSFNNILDLSRLEAGAVCVNIQQVSIEHLFANIESEFQALAQAKGITLRVRPGSSSVFSDPVLLERILRNLLGNAIHYTGQGKILLGCRRRKRHLVIQVLDTGCGIDPESQSEIFDIYKRSTDQHNHANGIGIGLSIVKQMCDLLEHPLSMTSRVGRGTQFSITVPLINKTHSNLLNNHIEKQPKPPLVVLVFENPEYREKITEHFLKWGCSIETAPSVEAAYKMAVNAHNNDINILLCDYACISRELTSPDTLQSLTQHYVAACICDADGRLPESWIDLSGLLPPAQLRTLLNLVYRRRNSVVI